MSQPKNKSASFRLKEIYKRLYAHFGPQHWWPADSPFEVMVGAILTQSTNWGNVERAIANLKKAKVLTPRKIIENRKSKIENWIKPSGYFRQKAKKLKAFVKFFLREYDGSVRKMREDDGSRRKMREGEGGELRRKLLAVHGIGPETADSILLYALDKPSFVVDAYTRRIGKRLGLFNFDDYHKIKELFESNLPHQVKLFNEYHALLVALGKYFCQPKPKCAKCPISCYCAD